MRSGSSTIVTGRTDCTRRGGCPINSHEGLSRIFHLTTCSECSSVIPSIWAEMVCTAVCLFVCPSLHICLSVCMSVSPHMSVCLYVCLSTYVCLSVCMSVSPHMSVCLYVCLSISLWSTLTRDGHTYTHTNTAFYYSNGPGAQYYVYRPHNGHRHTRGMHTHAHHAQEVT